MTEKGLEADFVYDGYNKANLVAAAQAEKGGIRQEARQDGQEQLSESTI
ncbi:MAG: hypothetical protein ACLRPC_07090 [Streptococcus sp.]